MKVKIKCECCQKNISIDSKDIKETVLSEYINSSGDAFSGFICYKCKRLCDNSAFATFKSIRLRALNEIKQGKTNKNESKN